ncbi:MAG: hypothetical protein ACRDMA_08180 [Solirubrobacterales bacterium]
MIERRADEIEVRIVNPVGDPETRPGGGRGVAGMRERATMVGGSLDAKRDGDCFRVRAVLPYDRR